MMFDNKNNLITSGGFSLAITAVVVPLESVHQPGGHVTAAASPEGDAVSVKRCFDTWDFWKTAPCVYWEAFCFVITSFQTNLLTQLTEALSDICS